MTALSSRSVDNSTQDSGAFTVTLAKVPTLPPTPARPNTNGTEAPGAGCNWPMSTIGENRFEPELTVTTPRSIAVCELNWTEPSASIEAIEIGPRASAVRPPWAFTELPLIPASIELRKMFPTSPAIPVVVRLPKVNSPQDVSVCEPRLVAVPTVSAPPVESADSVVPTVNVDQVRSPPEVRLAEPPVVSALPVSVVAETIATGPCVAVSASSATDRP